MSKYKIGDMVKIKKCSTFKHCIGEIVKIKSFDGIYYEFDNTHIHKEKELELVKNILPNNFGLLRKDMPVFSGVLKYFPDALLEISKVSKAGNDQHNKGEPLHWDKSKSTDEEDAGLRHLIDVAKGNKFDTDGIRHRAKYAWRALASLQREIENETN